MENEIIVLRSVFGANGATTTVQPVKDKYGMYPEHIRKVDSNGDMILSESDKHRIDELLPEDHVVELYSGRIFNLALKKDKAEWEAIKNCDSIAYSLDETDETGRNKIHGDMYGDRNYEHTYENDIQARYGTAEFVIEKPDEVSKSNVGRIKKVYDAQSYVINDVQGHEGRKRKCLLLGRSMIDASENEVLEYLLGLAKDKPETIINIYTSSTTGTQLMLLEALDKGIIVKENGTYMYGNAALGVTNEGVVAWLTDNRNRTSIESIRAELSRFVTDMSQFDNKTVKDAVQEYDIAGDIKPKGKSNSGDKDK